MPKKKIDPTQLSLFPEEINQAEALLKDKKIRRIINPKDGMLYFSIIDVIDALDVSQEPNNYWYALKNRLLEDGSQLLTICKKFKFLAVDGKMRPTDCYNREQLLRIIQSIPSPKVESFKLWLAKVGNERLNEMADPELAIKMGRERAIEFYRKKGHDDAWIKDRIEGIEARLDFTDWLQWIGFSNSGDYAKATILVHDTTFGISLDGHKAIKGIEKGGKGFRNRCNRFELVFTRLGELSAQQIGEERKAKGIEEGLDACKEGGEVAREARVALEKKLGRSVITHGSKLGLSA